MPDRAKLEAGSDVPETLPKLLLRNWKMHPNRMAMRKKDLGIWNRYTWDDCYQNTKYIAMGLASQGFKRGDKVCIIGDNDPEWVWSELATHALGGITVGLYIDAIPSDLSYIVSHAECRFAFAKDQEQVDKFLEVKDQLPNIDRIFYWDPKGMTPYRDNPLLLPLNELIEQGRKYAELHPEAFDKSLQEGKKTDLALLSYTSGTTGLPKGAMITYEYLIQIGVKFHKVNPTLETDDYVSFVPPAWIAEQMMITGWLLWRSTINFPEAPETVMENVREIGPQFLFLGPRQWQGLLATVQMKINDAHIIKRWIYELSLKIAYKKTFFYFDERKEMPILWKLLYTLAEWACLLHVRDQLGLSRVRVALTGGSALGPDVFRWFHAIGVMLKEGYGLTEINPVAGHTDRIKLGTVGTIAEGVKVKITEEGEILATSNVFFKGYYKQPEETAKTIQDGWVRTGDAGLFDDEGHLIILDRVKDLLTLKGGEKYSPSYIENRLKFSPYIKDVMVVGGKERDFIFAIINIDFDNVGKWAEKRGISYTTFVDLSQKREIYDLILPDVKRVNQNLPEKAKVKRFSLLHKEFDPDEGELTKTRKLRRSFLEQRYANLINAAYAFENKIITEAEVKYRDGRKSVIKTEMNIRTVEG